MTDQFGKINFSLVCRFNELTKNEIRVLVYLYVCRNEKTGQCNPSRKLIAARAKIEKGNLSKAIGGLQKKGWILEHDSGQFTLFDALKIPEKVVKTTTRKVIKSPTKVVEVTTKNCRNNNLHYKEENKEGTKKEQRKNIAETSFARSRNQKLRPPEYKPFREMLFEIHHKRLNGAVSDVAAQNDAIGWLFDQNFSCEDCLTLYIEQIKDLEPNGWRSQVCWLTVRKNIGDWVSQGKPTKRQNEQNNTNKKTNTEIFKSRDYSKFDGFDPVKVFGGA